MLTASELECVRGERRLFAGLGFELKPGTLLAVRGANGSGKTTLLRMLCGLMLPAAGRIAWNGNDITQLGEEYRCHLAYLGHLNALKDELDPLENLRHALKLGGIAADEDQLLAALEWSGMQSRRHQSCATLSQGQRRRVALARIRLSQARKLWILDEPFAALDVAAVDRTSAMIAAHLAAGGIVALTTHQEVPINAPVAQSIELAA